MPGTDATPLDVAAMFVQAAEEFEAAAAHCRVSSTHYERRDIPAGCAHKVAAQGHLARGNEVLRQISIIHSEHASLPGE